MDWTDLYVATQSMMSERRFRHTLGVVELAELLARSYGLDHEKARTAALLHDYARSWPKWQLLKKAEEFAIVVTVIDRAQPELLHGPVGAELARREFGITDQDVLEAIHWHTTGSPGMGDLAKVVYVADGLEQGRDYPGIEQLRQVMFGGLDRIYLDLLHHTMSYLLANGNLIHPESLHARNHLLMQKI